jgi:nicotinate-nucleotide adenylyltransferase
MLEIALADHPGLFVSPIQLRKENLNRTVDLIGHIRQEIPPDSTQLFLILGADCIGQLQHWKNPAELLSSVQIIACSRNGYQRDHVLSDINRIADISGSPAHSIPIVWTDVGLPATSSSKIRESLVKGEEPHELDPRIFEHITKYRLYI